MSKKRKEPTNQSSTILDFFGKGSTASNTRDAKKLKANGALLRRKSVPPVKRELPEDIIIIEDSDDDEAGDVLPQLSVAPPAARRVRPKSVAGRPSGGGGARGVTASEQRPMRVTRSTAAAAANARKGAGAGVAV